MDAKYQNLILFALLFALVAAAASRYPLPGAFLAGLYLSNGIAHFGYGLFGFGKITPKTLFGEERGAHSIWGAYNFILSAILVRNSSLGTNWPAFIAAILITLLLLPIAARKEK